jgi:hypothetical protein
MSLTLLQRFFEIAKQEAEAPALGVEVGESFQSLPWWFVKSRVKHFGLGLLEAGGKPGDYFYLLPSLHPTWIYSELGALTMGLKTLPLPPAMTKEAMERLFAKYPPAFIYWGDGGAETLPWSSYKTLKALVTKSEDSLHPEKPPPPFLSFREVFNSGIQFESKHHAAYRRTREDLQETHEMSPIWVDRRGTITERPVRYGDVNQMMTRLSQVFHLPKIRRIFSDVDFWWTEGRMIGVYWPLFLALQAVRCGENTSLLEQFKATSPDVAFLSEASLAKLEHELSARLSPKSASTPGTNSLAMKWRTALQARRLRRQLGGKLRLLVTNSPLGPVLEKSLAAAKIRSLSPEGLGEIP